MRLKCCFSNVLPRSAAIAQLGERETKVLKAMGSNPIRGTLTVAVVAEPLAKGSSHRECRFESCRERGAMV